MIFPASLTKQQRSALLSELRSISETLNDIASTYDLLAAVERGDYTKHGVRRRRQARLSGAVSGGNTEAVSR